MADLITLHPEKEATVTLAGSQWLALMLKLAGRDHNAETVAWAEAAMLDQLAKVG
jgi:hypothetical protein